MAVLTIIVETLLLQDPHIQAVLMFGRGQVQNGVIIHPKEPFDARDESKLEAFRNLIWHVYILAIRQL